MYNTLLKSFFANIISEFGDKTFILSALISMKYNGFYVFIGSSLGFILMTFLGSIVGYILPLVVSIKIIKNIWGIIFLFFG